MQQPVENAQLFYEYYRQWIDVYKKGAIREATLDKYLMTQKWVEKLAPELKVYELTRTAYQKLLNDYAKNHEKQTTLDFHHQLKGAVLDAVDEGMIERDPTRKAIIKGKSPGVKKIKYLNQFELHTLIAHLDIKEAVNWDWFGDKIRQANRPIKVLNLFAYTGGATLAAAAAGASVTHVDASKGMVAWAKDNAALSGLSDKPIRWLVDDCVKFVEREIRRGNHYDGIIMDPPSYGRGPKGEIWKIEEKIFPFVELCTKVLSKDPLFFLINSYTTGLQPAVLSYMMNTALVPKFGGHVDAQEIGLPVSSNGLVLPCGASGRWERSKS